MSQPTPQQLIDALTDNGFTPRFDSGILARYDWPETGLTTLASLAVSTEPRRPGHEVLNASVLAVLARAVDTGRHAAAALASLGGQQQAAHPALEAARAAVMEQMGWADDRHLAGSMEYPVACWEVAGEVAQAVLDTVKSSTDEEPTDTSNDPSADSGPTPRAQSALQAAENRLLTAQVERVRWMAGVAGRSLASGTAISQDLIDFTDDVRQLLDLPGCRYCTPGCTSCSFDGDCECYDHQDEPPVKLPCEFESAGLDLSPAVERITASASDASLCGDTWLPAGLVDRDAIAGWRHADGIEPDPIAVLDEAIAASGVRVTFDPRHVVAPHTHRGPKATDPDREHPAHDGQTCEEYEAQPSH